MKKTVRISLITIASLIALGALFLIVVAWPGSTKKIERVADQFQPSSEWVLQSETINPPRILCLMADCGEIHRVWRLEANITTEEFKDRIEQSGWQDMWNDSIECKTNERFSGGEVMCRVEGVVEGKDVSLRASGDHADPSMARIVLSVREAL